MRKSIQDQINRAAAKQGRRLPEPEKAATAAQGATDDADAFYAELKGSFTAPIPFSVEFPNGTKVQFIAPASAKSLKNLYKAAENLKNGWQLLEDEQITNLCSQLDAEEIYAASMMASTVHAPKLKLWHFLDMAVDMGAVFLALSKQVTEGLVKHGLGAIAKQVNEQKKS